MHMSASSSRKEQEEASRTSHICGCISEQIMLSVSGISESPEARKKPAGHEYISTRFPNKPCTLLRHFQNSRKQQPFTTGMAVFRITHLFVLGGFLRVQKTERSQQDITSRSVNLGTAHLLLFGEIRISRSQNPAQHVLHVLEFPKNPSLLDSTNSNLQKERPERHSCSSTALRTSIRSRR
jgi:hypothetical protein